jgi:hypothetical protein
VPNGARAFVANLGRVTPSICSSLSFRQGQAFFALARQLLRDRPCARRAA